MLEIDIAERKSLDRDVMLLSCAAFASAMALRLCDPILPALAKDFGTSLGQAAVVVTSISIAYGIFQLLFGPLGDHFGKFQVIAWACLVSSVGAAASALSPNLEILSMARALNGATTAALIPLAMAWIGDVVAFDHRQATLAKFMSGQIIGLVGGQAIAGFFADHFGWRWAFVLLAAIYLSVGSLLLASLQRHRHARISAGASNTTSSARRFRLVLGDAHARFILAIVFTEAMAVFGTIAFIPAFLHQRFEISLFHSGAITAAIGLGGLSYTLFARRWVKLVGPIRLAWSGGILIGAALALLAIAPAWGWGIVACAVAGLGFYQLHNTLQTMATQMTPAARGTAVSLFASSFFLGQATGVSLGAIAVDRIGAPWLFGISALVLPVIGVILAGYLKSHAKRQADTAPAAR
jgi:predicted MFS family arabinose efflux permease